MEGSEELESRLLTQPWASVCFGESALIAKACFGDTGYVLLLSDLSSVWYESADAEAVGQRSKVSVWDVQGPPFLLTPAGGPAQTVCWRSNPRVLQDWGAHTPPGQAPCGCAPAPSPCPAQLPPPCSQPGCCACPARSFHLWAGWEAAFPTPAGGHNKAASAPSPPCGTSCAPRDLRALPTTQTLGFSRVQLSRAPLNASSPLSPGAEQAADGPRLLLPAPLGQPHVPLAGRAARPRHLLLLPAHRRWAQPAGEERALGPALLLGLPLLPRAHGDGEITRGGLGKVPGASSARWCPSRRAPPLGAPHRAAAQGGQDRACRAGAHPREGSRPPETLPGKAPGPPGPCALRAPEGARHPPERAAPRPRSQNQGSAGLPGRGEWAGGGCGTVGSGRRWAATGGCSLPEP